MNYKNKFFIVGLILLVLISVSVVSAEENMTAQESNDMVTKSNFGIDAETTIKDSSVINNNISEDCLLCENDEVIGSAKNDEILEGVYNNKNVEIMIADEVSYGAYGIRLKIGNNQIGELNIYVNNNLKFTKNLTKSDYKDNLYWAFFYPKYLEMSPPKIYLVNVTFKSHSYSSYLHYHTPDNYSDYYNDAILNGAIVEGEDLLLNLSVPNEEREMHIYIDDKLFKSVYPDNGKIEEVISGLSAGKHKFKLMYDEPYFYLDSFDIYVKGKTQFSFSPLTTVYNSGKYIFATLLDSHYRPISGVKVKMELSNGKTVTPTTDEYGQVKFLTNGLSPKTFSAKVTFDGNSYYVGSTKSIEFIVKKATPKLTASKKTFKKSVKTKKYTITLKTNQNKVMKNTWVTLNVNKKTYKVKTNSRGQATFKITNLNKKGTFTAVVKYAGNSYYNAKIVKPKIIVK